MEYTYRPMPKNKNATYLVLALGLSSFLFLFFGMINLASLRSVWHLCFLALAVAAIYYLLRYFCSYYVYTVTDQWGEPTLVVAHVQGRRASTHCRLGLSHLLRLVEVEDPASEEGKRALAEFNAERARYSYLATIGNAPFQILYGREGGIRFAIRLEADAAFLGVIRRAAELAAQYTPTEGADDDGE